MVKDTNKKRVDQSARTVIGPDPTLRFDEVGVPPEIASNLTIPEIVCAFNIKHLTELVNNGKANYVKRGDVRINLKYALFRKGTELLYGDEVLRGDQRIRIGKGELYMQLCRGDMIIRNGKKLEEIKFPQKKRFNLKLGDIVERQLRDSDIVLINRQPTLRKESMLAKKVVIKPGKTIRLSLATVSVFGADFDGDEMVKILMIRLKQVAV